MAEETIQAVLQELRAERDKLDRAIQALEGTNGTRTNGRRARTSRKPMSAAMKREVSRRMKKYWAKRRAEKAKGRKNGARKAA